MALGSGIGHVAGQGLPSSFHAEIALWPLTAAVVCLALLLGGGTHQGLWSDAVVQLAGLLLLGVLLPTLLQPAFIMERRGVLAVVIAIALLPLLQLVRLPPALWTLLPGRDTFSAAYDAAGVSLPWLPISLDPAATWRSFLALIPPIAVFLATICSGLQGAPKSQPVDYRRRHYQRVSGPRSIDARPVKSAALLSG